MAVSEGSADIVSNRARTSRRIFMLLIVGAFTIVLGLAILTIAAVMSGSSSTGYGIIIFIGPIPIVLGAGPSAPWLILFAIILAALSIIVFFVMRKRTGEIDV